jgi:hypothetical protein
MTQPLFNKLSKEIGLVLISSSLFLAGCRRISDEEQKDENGNPVQPAAGGWHGGGGHWGGYYPFIGRTGAGLSGTSSGAPAASTSSSVRGGFGATGHAVSAGG